jgi:4-hydroxybenzoate polyprenyltransferase
MYWIITTYRKLNLLSIDVALGAVCSAMFFASVLKVVILPYAYLALAFTVWIVYTMDHLLDAIKIKGPASTSRHRFHQKYFGNIVLALIMAIITDGILIMFIREPVLMGGLILAGLVTLYLILHSYLRFCKELLIGILYTSGVLLPSVAVISIYAEGFPWILILQFFLTALTNILLFTYLDYHNDMKDGSTSLSTIIGKNNMRRILIGLFVLVFGLSFFGIPAKGSFLIAIMDCILLLLFLFPGRINKGELFRMIGDAIFFIPVLYPLL